MTSTRNSACPSCGTPTLPEGARFCPSCGTLLAGAIPKGALSPEDELHPVTVMFPDVVGSIALGARLPPEEVKALVGECVSAMARAVEDHGGFVQAYQGDGICAVFGIPAAHEDDPERAARAALRILEVVGAYAHDVQATWGISSFNVRIGIDTGPAVVGTLGASDPQVSALGDATNTAARLQGAAEPGEIVMGQSTAARLSDRFVLREVGPFALKGKAEPVRAFRVVGERRESSPRSLLPLVGRDQERKELSRVLADLASGRGQVVSIIGEAGIGKSRLLAELHAMTGPDLTWLEGRCLSYGGELTYWPFIEILRGWLEVTEGEAEVAVRLRLKAKLTSLLGPRTPEVLPYLGRLLSVKLDPEVEERVRYLPPEALAEQIHQAYRMWVEALAAPHPLILAIEDLHWADPSTRALAEALVAATEHAPLLLACAYRAEPDSEAWKFRLRVMEGFSHRAKEISLRSLPERDAGLLADALAQGELGPESRNAIVARAEGNPLYLEQLLHSLLERDQLQRRVLISVAGPDLTLVPPALEGLLASRIDGLPAGARSLAQIAAVCGRSFLRRVLERVEGGPQFNTNLSALLKSQLVREHKRTPELEYIFTHGLIQEAALSRLTASRRSELHGRVAAAFEESFASAGEEYLEIIAHHYAESPNREKALVYLERSGQKAASLFANDQAIELWERARRAARDLERKDAYLRITERLGEILVSIGRLDEGADRYRELAGHSRSVNERAHLLGAPTWALVDAGRMDQAAVLVEEALGQGPTDPAVVACLFQTRALAAYRADRLGAMRSDLDAVDEFSADRLPLEVSIRQSFLWKAYWSESGDHEKAKWWAERGLHLAEESGDPIRILDGKRRLALARARGGDLRGARDMLRDAYDLARGIGYVAPLVGSGVNLLVALSFAGDLPSGLALGAELLPVVSSPYWRSLTLETLAGMEFEAGRSGVARAHVRESLDIAEQSGQRERYLRSLLRLASMQIMEGETKSADSLLSEALTERGDREGGSSLRAGAHCWLGQLRLAEGDSTGAEREALIGLEEASRSEPVDAVPLWRLLGEALEARKAGLGLEALERARDLSRAAGMRLEEGRALMAIARRLPTEQQQATLKEARRIFEECGGARELAALDAI